MGRNHISTAVCAPVLFSTAPLIQTTVSIVGHTSYIQHNDDQPATNTGRQGNDQRISGFSDRRCLASPSTEHYQPEDQLQEIPRTRTSKTTTSEPAQQRRLNQTVPTTREDDYKLYREVKLQNQPSRPSYSGTLRSRDDPQHHSSNREKIEKIFKVEKNITK